MRRSRLLYNATAKPTILCGAPVLGLQPDGEPIVRTTLRRLEGIQNRCLRKITGGYKRTSRAALEREAAIPSIDLQIDQLALQHSTQTAPHRVNTETSVILDQVWNSARGTRRRNDAPTRPWAMTP
jgi:hypothetical protein